MAEKNELTGPDLEVGTAMWDLPKNTPVLRDAHGEVIVPVRMRREASALGPVCSHYGGPLEQGLVCELQFPVRS